ncbi:MAG: hypothetical protein ACE5I3_02420 [Phycisphaerae bacterium]
MPRRSAWAGKLGLAAAVALLWVAFHYVVDATVLARGLDRPVVVLVGDGGVLAAAVVLVLVLAGALVGGLLSGRGNDVQGLLTVGLALALWAWPGGTMDDWLKMKNQTAGPPTGSAYWPLLAEYVYWTVVVAAVLALATWRSRSSDKARSRANWRRALGLDLTPGALRDGITGLILTVAIAATLVLILSGPRVGHTYRGQAYFAVALAFVVAVLIARRLTGARGVIWYLPGPLIVGILGVLLAAWKPGVGAGYENINVIPAWGLVRPLPVQMVSVGLVAILLTLRTATRLSSDENQG